MRSSGEDSAHNFSFLPFINDLLLCDYNTWSISSSCTLTKTHNKQLQDAMNLPANFLSNICIFPSSFSQIAVAAEVHIFTALQTKSNTRTASVNYGLNKNTSERDIEKSFKDRC